MVRVLFYLVILAAGAALAYIVAQAVMSVSPGGPADVPLEGPPLPPEPLAAVACDPGPQILGLPARELVVGAVTTLFGITMQAVGGRMIRRR